MIAAIHGLNFIHLPKTPALVVEKKPVESKRLKYSRGKMHPGQFMGIAAGPGVVVLHAQVAKRGVGGKANLFHRGSWRCWAVEGRPGGNSAVKLK